MKSFFLLFFCLNATLLFAQFSIGHRTATYADPTRSGGFGSGGGSGRQIQCEIYYPSNSAGDNVAVSAGQFPIITFGHGFVMSWDAYANIWEHYVSLGYILIFPRTEGGFTPAHQDFGKDLTYVTTKFIENTSNASNPFYQAYNGKCAIMGHSMGGGASVLAANEAGAPFNVYVGMAPAETNPAASSAATGVSIPSLIFSGTGDAVTPPADHHLPIFQNLASNCKYFVSITGGAHCYFANSNFNCDLGEGASGGTISITRAEQQNSVFGILDFYLNCYLKGNSSAWSQFTNALTNPGVVSTTSCAEAPVGLEELANDFTLYPNPTQGLLTFDCPTCTEQKLQIWSIDGLLLMEMNAAVKATINLDGFENGIYLLKVGDRLKQLIKH